MFGLKWFLVRGRPTQKSWFPKENKPSWGQASWTLVNDGGTNVTGDGPRLFPYILKPPEWSQTPQERRNLRNFVIRFGTRIFWIWKSLTTFSFTPPDCRLLRICDWAGCRCCGSKWMPNILDQDFPLRRQSNKPSNCGSKCKTLKPPDSGPFFDLIYRLVEHYETRHFRVPYLRSCQPIFFLAPMWRYRALIHPPLVPEHPPRCLRHRWNFWCRAECVGRNAARLPGNGRVEDIHGADPWAETVADKSIDTCNRGWCHVILLLFPGVTASKTGMTSTICGQYVSGCWD